MKYTNGSWGLGHAVLTWLCDGYWPSPARQEESLDRIRRAQDRYIPVGLFATGAVTDVVCATAVEDEAPVLLKISRIAGGNSHLENERNILARLRQAAGTTTY